MFYISRRSVRAWNRAEGAIGNECCAMKCSNRAESERGGRKRCAALTAMTCSMRCCRHQVGQDVRVVRSMKYRTFVRTCTVSDAVTRDVLAPISTPANATILPRHPPATLHQP